MIVYRHVDPRFPFLREDAGQVPGRWHAVGEGPAQYFADTPDGAWAELLRHEEIRDPEDLATIRRSIWAVEIDDREVAAAPSLPEAVLTGGLDSHEACQREAARLRAGGTTRIDAPSAALVAGGAGGWCVDGGLRRAAPRDGRTVVLFGRRPALVGWLAAADGRPEPSLLERVRHLGKTLRRTTRRQRSTGRQAG